MVMGPSSLKQVQSLKALAKARTRGWSETGLAQVVRISNLPATPVAASAILQNQMSPKQSSFSKVKLETGLAQDAKTTSLLATTSAASARRQSLPKVMVLS